MLLVDIHLARFPLLLYHSVRLFRSPCGFRSHPFTRSNNGFPKQYWERAFPSDQVLLCCASEHFVWLSYITSDRLSAKAIPAIKELFPTIVSFVCCRNCMVFSPAQGARVALRRTER
jgi:hypothetical protein